MVEGARLESEYMGKTVSWVQIPLSPPETMKVIKYGCNFAVLDGEVAVPCNLAIRYSRIEFHLKAYFL